MYLQDMTPEEKDNFLKKRQENIHKSVYGEPLEKGGEHKNHKYIRKEGDKYIYEDKNGKLFHSNEKLHEDIKRVSHSRFGDGSVISEDLKTIKVKFDNFGEKSLLKEFAQLKNIDTLSEVSEDKNEASKKDEGSEKKLKEENDFESDIEINEGTYISVLKDGKTHSVNIQSFKNGVVNFYGKGIGGGKMSESDFRKIIKPESLKKKRVEKEAIKIDNTKILHATDKAYRIEQKGKELWIPKSWVDNSDGVKILTIKNKFNNKFIEAIENASESKKPTITDKFKIKKETDKAYLIGINIKQASGTEREIEEWFPKSKVNKEGNGDLKIDGAFLHTKEQEINEKYGEIKTSFSPSKTTDKAVGFDINVYENLSEQTIKRMMWFPKSMVKESVGGTYIIPKNIYEKAVKEIYDSVKTGGWSNSSNSVFELDGIENFNIEAPALIKAYKILGIK